MIRYIFCHIDRILTKYSIILLLVALISSTLTVACRVSPTQLVPPAKASPTLLLPTDTFAPLTPMATLVVEDTSSPILPTLVIPPSTPTTTGEVGVEGKVEIGPTCGNQSQQNNADCSNNPYETQLTVTDLDGRIVIQSKSDVNGFFHISLSPGEYILIPESANFLSISPIPFNVSPDAFTYVPVIYHTDIQ